MSTRSYGSAVIFEPQVPGLQMLPGSLRISVTLFFVILENNFFFNHMLILQSELARALGTVWHVLPSGGGEEMGSPAALWLTQNSLGNRAHL